MALFAWVVLLLSWGCGLRLGFDNRGATYYIPPSALSLSEITVHCTMRSLGSNPESLAPLRIL